MRLFWLQVEGIVGSLDDLIDLSTTAQWMRLVEGDNPPRATKLLTTSYLYPRGTCYTYNNEISGQLWHEFTQLAMVACSVGLGPKASQGTKDIMALLLLENTVSPGLAYIHDKLRTIMSYLDAIT